MTTPTAIDVGWKPRRINPVFSKRQDWIAVFEPDGEDPDFPVGTTFVFKVYDDPDVDIEIYTTNAVLVDGEIRFKIESAITDPIPAGKQIRIYAEYPNSPTPDNYTWAKGIVKRDD